MSWEITYYKKDSGRIPVIEYIELQESEQIAKIRNNLRLLRESGVRNCKKENERLFR